MSNHATRPEGPALVVVEGLHDITFLKGFSQVLHPQDASLPDLDELEGAGRIVFIPVGGDLNLWSHRLAAVGLPEFHLFGREVETVTEDRRQIVDAINRRPGCVARLTRKRQLECYLHGSAIRAVCGLELDFDDNSDVAELVARQLLAATAGPDWQHFPRRSRSRLKNRVKRMLTQAVRLMTPALLAEVDPQGEVADWLGTIAQLARSNQG